MNLLAEAPMWTAWLLAALLVLAAVQDLAQLRISNLFPIALILLAVVTAAVAGPRVELWQNLLVFVGLLAFGTMLFATGKFGGGDAKLLAVTGLWVDLPGAPALLASVFIAGGVLALLLIAARMLAPASMTGRVKVLGKQAGIPYGVAIAAGALVAAVLVRP
jgi:prepilin peptidase CpaA